MKLNRRWLALVPAVVALAIALVASSTSGAASKSGAAKSDASGSITVWVDAPREPVTDAYIKSHPNVHVTKVIFDGDGNGATDLQTKIQLWNRTGSGWPDVIFSEQANDPVWMGQKPFDFATDLKKVFPANLIKGWPKPSLAQCTVNGRLVCLQDNLAQEVLYVNQKLMKQFGYTVPKTWQQWAAIGKKVAKQHPGYIIGTVGDSYGHWLYLWSNKCPIEQVVGPKTVKINSSDVHCTEMAKLLDPLLKSGVVANETIFGADFPKKYGGANDKILMMPGPTWYAGGNATSVLGSGTLGIPAGEMAAALPLRWNKDPLTTGQVGGGPWIISKHTQNMAAAVDFVKWVTTTNEARKVAGGYPAYTPAANFQLYSMDHDPYFAAPPGPAMKAAANLIWKGWSMVTYPDQPSWSNQVVAKLIQGKSLSSLLPGLGKSLSDNAKAAGYKVVTK
jgi:ABC-type glycerol-3-phosphate transport system substrate-binding protein